MTQHHKTGLWTGRNQALRDVVGTGLDILYRDTIVFCLFSIQFDFFRKNNVKKVYTCVKKESFLQEIDK